MRERDPFEAIAETVDAIESLTREWPANRFERTYDPGKWTARQVVTHLAQTELAIGTRARMALVTPGYVAQVWDQDTWIVLDAMPGRVAVETFAALARMNRGFFQGLSPERRETTFAHPEYGELDDRMDPPSARRSSNQPLETTGANSVRRS